MTRRITDFDVMPYVEHTTDIIAACKAIDAEPTTPPADNMAKCAEALAVLISAVGEVLEADRKIDDDARENHRHRDWLGVRAHSTLIDAQRRALDITEGETP